LWTDARPSAIADADNKAAAKVRITLFNIVDTPKFEIIVCDGSKLVQVCRWWPDHHEAASNPEQAMFATLKLVMRQIGTAG
jgi:hypothetical protein